MKLTSSKEEADALLEKAALKEERLQEELQMKQVGRINAKG